MHWSRWSRTGSTEHSRKQPLEKRLLAGRHISESGCWLWTGFKRKGYGRISVNGPMVRVHRAAYELWVGPIPEGLTIDHLCRVTSCFNPEHLEAVTARENVLRGENPAAANARKTHCVHGHPFKGENLYITPTGRRSCRTCTRERARAYRAAARNGANLQSSDDDLAAQVRDARKGTA